MKILITRFIAIGALLTLIIACKKENPGPISVENSITPTIVESGDYVTWTIKVTNSGGKVKIERIHCREEIISGWAEGNYAELDIPISNSEVDAHKTEVIHSQTSPVLNIGWTDVEVENTVTVYSNGGTDTDICTYKILMHTSTKQITTPKAVSIVVHNEAE